MGKSLYERLIDRTAMISVTVSPKYQVVIPKSVREALGIEPGQKLQVITYDNRIEMIPVEPPHKRRGFLHGIATDIPREDDRF